MDSLPPARCRMSVNTKNVHCFVTCYSRITTLASRLTIMHTLLPLTVCQCSSLFHLSNATRLLDSCVPCLHRRSFTGFNIYYLLGFSSYIVRKDRRSTSKVYFIRLVATLHYTFNLTL